MLNIPDVYRLPPHVPYRFNRSLDDKTGYRTHSLLTVPLFSRNQELLGVLQLINSLNPASNTPHAFAARDELDVLALSREAGSILEISNLVRKHIYRLLRMTSIHDPTETGPHAERVGAVAAEVYQRWALKAGLNPDDARHVRSQLRLAAMLHDIGKVGISDLILKKPGRLDADEFAIMQTHTAMGASLLEEDVRDLTDMARVIALHHHQKWNGSGYGGTQEPLAGEDIPLPARITALADVFDALVSPRCYKTPRPFPKALALLQEEAGRHFDPTLVTCFQEVMDIVERVYARYPDAASTCTVAGEV